jgi:hypothetical protein
LRRRCRQVRQNARNLGQVGSAGIIVAVVRNVRTASRQAPASAQAASADDARRHAPFLDPEIRRGVLLAQPYFDDLGFKVLAGYSSARISVRLLPDFRPRFLEAVRCDARSAHGSVVRHANERGAVVAEERSGHVLIDFVAFRFVDFVGFSAMDCILFSFFIGVFFSCFFFKKHLQNK